MESNPIDPWYYEQLQPHQSRLRSWLQRRFPSVRKADRDDILQEAYVRVLTTCRTRGKLKYPKAFLYTTVRNLALDLLRHNNVVREKTLVENGTWDVLDEGTAIPEAVARKQELSFLNEAIESLPKRCRQVFVMRRIYGMSQKEIGAQLGVSEHTVSAQLTIALHKCTEYVNNRCKEPGIR